MAKPCKQFIMKKKIQKFFSNNFKNEKAGVLEYLFAFTAFISILPSVLVYMILVKLIIDPVKTIVSKIWK